MKLSLDFEATGLDLVHGVMPFLPTTCDDKGQVRFVEWNVNPLTRIPSIPQEDIRYFQTLIDEAELIYFHNSQFDVRCAKKIGITIPWHKVRDSFVAAHLLGTNLPHNLTDSCTIYIGKNIERYELEVKQAVKECRSIVKKQFPNWRIAKEGEEDMPSVSASSKRDEDKPLKADMWLPRALALELGYPALDESCQHLFWNLETTNKKCTRCGGHFWFCVTSRYANADSIHTLPLGLRMEQLIQERGYWSHYLHRLELMRCACEMVSYGVTVIGNYTEETIRHYTEFCAESNDALISIAEDYGHELELASGASLNDNMRDFFYGSIKQTCHVCGTEKRIKHWNGEVAIPQEDCPKCLKGSKRKSPKHSPLHTTHRPNLDLPVILSKKTGNACLDKDIMQEYLATTDGEANSFIKILIDKRKHETDLTYMQSYKRFWVPCEGSPGYYRIHPSLNPFGTDHLRWSSNSPNLQNVGKQEDRCDDCDGKGCDTCNFTGKTRVSVRNCFGPMPGREWYSMDFMNIELRIPAYESGEEAMIELFESPDKPPYFGSYHCLNGSIVYEDLFFQLVCPKCLNIKKCENGCSPKVCLSTIEGGFKKKYKSTEYQWDKNGGFAMQYNCGETKADTTFRRVGAYKLLKAKLPKVAALNAKYVREANKTGYVTTLPSRAIDPDKGYPILASRTEDNYVLSTTPFNYHTSGTACECKNIALVRCRRKCEEWRKKGIDVHIPLEIHDELIFDFKKGQRDDSNLEFAMELKKIMEQSGEDLIPRIPTPVSVERHDRTWAEGVAIH